MVPVLRIWLSCFSQSHLIVCMYHALGLDVTFGMEGFKRHIISWLLLVEKKYIRAFLCLLAKQYRTFKGQGKRDEATTSTKCPKRNWGCCSSVSIPFLTRSSWLESMKLPIKPKPDIRTYNLVHVFIFIQQVYKLQTLMHLEVLKWLQRSCTSRYRYLSCACNNAFMLVCFYLRQQQKQNT